MYSYPYFNDNIFTGYYVSSYNDVLNMAVPSNGQGVLFANLDEGLLWSKKLINNQAYIQAYKIEPINQVGVPNDNASIMEQLQIITQRLNKMEEKYEPKSTVNVNTNGTIEK